MINVLKITAITTLVIGFYGCGGSEYDYSGNYYVTYGDDCEKVPVEGLIAERTSAVVNKVFLKVFKPDDPSEIVQLEDDQRYAELLEDEQYYAELLGGLSHSVYFKVADDGAAEIAFSDDYSYDPKNWQSSTALVVKAKPNGKHNILITEMIDYPVAPNTVQNLLESGSEVDWLSLISGKEGLCLERR